MLRRATARRAAFTLIELIVVLMGLVMMAAAVVPSITAAGRQGELERVAGRVAASARLAREMAVEHQAAISLTVETAPDALHVAWEDETTAQPAGGFRAQEEVTLPPLPRRFALVPLPTRVAARLESAPEEIGPSVPAGSGAARGESNALRFPADGRPEGGVIVLTDERGRERRVVVTPDTGVVRIEGENG